MTASPPSLTDPVVHEPPSWRVRDLTGGGDRARILHDGQIYTLQITRAGKLILTK